MMHTGIDIGSTTAKLVLLNERQEVVFAAYLRHNAQVRQTLAAMLRDARYSLGDRAVEVCITGSAGMGIAERCGIPFVQEAVSSAEVVRRIYPDVRTLVDVGGEDTKMIFFDDRKRPDIRMNGNCAGGTGAFIDQMASLLNISIEELDRLASTHQHRYPIATRCGVFAKTDVQNLISRQIPRDDIAATIVQAVALQTKNTLARGTAITPHVLFCGGPLTFFPSLRQAFVEVLQISHEEVVLPEKSELFPALGAAMTSGKTVLQTTLGELIHRVECNHRATDSVTGALSPLFNGEKEFHEWQQVNAEASVGHIDLSLLEGSPCFLGVDSGSTTTKVVLIDSSGNIAYEYYANNKGDPIEAVKEGIAKLRRLATETGTTLSVCRSAVTGYGEDLIRAAFGFDEGIVETLAHHRAARKFRKDVTFILDIGGQDMKAIFIEDGVIKNISINEACSSGCGSFIETFAESLGYRVSDFALSACAASRPYDLGSRCTVFMNSRVKQALREGASIPDIAAGLAYSVARNCLQKVLKINDTDVLGDAVVVQGGTFRNPAVHRAFELLLGRKVICSSIPELMGAYGAALTALDSHNAKDVPGHPIALSALENVEETSRKTSTCRGCENNCRITTLLFCNKNRFHTGNKCERIFTNTGADRPRGRNLAEAQLQLLFDRPLVPETKPVMRIGIPRVLNMYEDFPFWCTLLVGCGFQVELSPVSTNEVCDRGCGTVMSDNICFPAKLVHGHVQSLVDSGVDRIFYPMVFFENDEHEGSPVSWNCPIVAAYPDVIRSAMNPAEKSGIPFDSPTITFRNLSLLREACYEYVRTLGVSRRLFSFAFRQAMSAQHQMKEALREKARAVLEESETTGRPLVILAARPYHLDPLVNHKIPEILAGLGVDVVTADALPVAAVGQTGAIQVLAQWSYPNRLYDAALWVSAHPGAELVQLNSFGCGPDSVAVDEVKSILAHHGKNHTVLRIDEVTSPGSVRLRLRSMIESLRTGTPAIPHTVEERKTTRLFLQEDRNRTILVPHFSPFYSAFIAGLLEARGYSVANLPPTDAESARLGLRYTNNEICYPAILVVGDMIKALQSGRYRTSDVAVGLTQTGGQCRASNYAPLIKKALISAGFEDVPVVTLSTSGQSQNEQPGFSVKMRQFLVHGFWGIITGDALSQMYYSTAVRELRKGEAVSVARKFITLADDLLRCHEMRSLPALLRSAAEEYNRIPVDDSPLPRIGIVGEIYVKYNNFSNNSIIEWLHNHQVEVALPPLINFFIQGFVNVESDTRLHLARKDLSGMIACLGERVVRRQLERVDEVLHRYKRYVHQTAIRDLASRASRIVSLADQFGEGWLIPADISELAERGVHNVLCLQPFGCIANHIVAKGVETRMRELFPQLNMLYLDMDPGAGEANLLNRLHFIVQGARECAESAA